MSLAKSTTVTINLQRIRQNALAVMGQTRVPLIAVVKADAYGMGASQVAEAVGDLVEAFYVFDAAEAVAGRLWDIAGKRTIALNGDWTDPQDFLSHHIQPVVWTSERARALKKAKPVLSIDTGQQRFSCPAVGAASVRKDGDCQEVMTHAIHLQQVDRLLEAVRGWDRGRLFLHAAGSALLAEPAARLSAVRPGLALYRGAARVAASLIDVRDSVGPAGYSGFTTSRFGVILAGYSHGLCVGPCKVNGNLCRLIEVGMQSSFVEIGPQDKIGDEVVLLADESGVDESAIATSWGTSQQEVLVRMTHTGLKTYT